MEVLVNSTVVTSIKLKKKKERERERLGPDRYEFDSRL